MEDDLNTIRGVVEELDSADLIQDRVVVVIDHIVCDDRR